MGVVCWQMTAQLPDDGVGGGRLGRQRLPRYPRSPRGAPAAVCVSQTASSTSHSVTCASLMTTVRSPDASSRDPYELDRLAEELAVREAHHQPAPLTGDDELSAEGRLLPLYLPFSHADPHLSAPTFDVEQFLLARAYTSLPDLRTELRDYLATLKEELVKLINDDYEAFISLSTDLRGEGARLENLKRPLGDLKARVLVCRVHLVTICACINSALPEVGV